MGILPVLVHASKKIYRIKNINLNYLFYKNLKHKILFIKIFNKQTKTALFGTNINNL
jgi:hypothetical protein